MSEKSKSNIKEIFSFKDGKEFELPLFTTKISAGFPSPADDHIDNKLNLNQYLISHKESTFFVKVEGDSMMNAGINHDDLLIVDRSLEAKNGSIIIAFLNGDLTVKRLLKKKDKFFLLAENPTYPTIEITAEMNFEMWGVVTYVIHTLV